jgi:hypothetical protein
MIDALRDPSKGEEMARGFESAGLRSLRFSFHGFYSPLGPEASARVKAENKLRNEFPWFPFDAYLDFISRHGFSTVVAVNVEEGPEVAAAVLDKVTQRGLRSKLVAVELSNEPWLNHRPWLPEEYAERAAGIIERLTPRRSGEPLCFGVPLTVGTERNTPTKLSDNEWVTRMLRALSRRIDLKNRVDIYGVIHLYARGVHARSIDAFNRIVQPFMPRVRYLVTEFNIRLSLEGNPHLTNKYAMEFARRVAEVMARPEIEAMYVHGVPYHSIVYWANRRVVTVVGHKDPKLPSPLPGWHLTPAGQVYELYSTLAWNGNVIGFGGEENKRYWAVQSRPGEAVVSFLNDTDKPRTQRVKLGEVDVELRSPARSIVCTNRDGKVIEALSLPY